MCTALQHACGHALNTLLSCSLQLNTQTSVQLQPTDQLAHHLMLSGAVLHFMMVNSILTPTPPLSMFGGVLCTFATSKGVEMLKVDWLFRELLVRNEWFMYRFCCPR